MNLLSLFGRFYGTLSKFGAVDNMHHNKKNLVSFQVFQRLNGSFLKKKADHETAEFLS